MMNRAEKRKTKASQSKEELLLELDSLETENRELRAQLSKALHEKDLLLSMWRKEKEERTERSPLKQQMPQQATSTRIGIKQETQEEESDELLFSLPPPKEQEKEKEKEREKETTSPVERKKVIAVRREEATSCVLTTGKRRTRLPLFEQQPLQQQLQSPAKRLKKLSTYSPSSSSSLSSSRKRTTKTKASPSKLLFPELIPSSPPSSSPSSSSPSPRKMNKEYVCRDCKRIFCRRGDRDNHEQLCGHTKWRDGKSLQLGFIAFG